MFESIGNYVILTNNSFIQAGRSGGYPRPHSKPIYATRGTREGYNARFVPYFGSSDNLVFVEGKIGVPSAAMVNWDDYYIHSSDDDLDKIDQTQLQRNNFIIGAMAFYLAYAEADEIPVLAAETFAQGGRRLAHDMQKALEILNESRNWEDAYILVEQGIEREKRALDSMRVIAGSDRAANASIDTFIRLIAAKEMSMRSELKALETDVDRTNPRAVPQMPASANKVPANIESSADYFAKRTRVRTALHSIMGSEVMNFVDGKRTYHDIYKAVKAESLSAGKFFYGMVTYDDVEKILDANVKSGALILK
ncbi:MAG: hypothetical protein OEM82_09100 [Acidobacteriota bacterium]|nr:hypothetical protein [Acidobacteriota bacterium]